MAETVPNSTGVIATEHDDLAALRAKKQRQLAAMPTSGLAGPERPAPMPPTAAPPEPPTPPITSAETVTPIPTSEASTGRSTSATKPRRPRQAAPRVDRAGQVMISGYFPTETRRRLKIIAARQDKTLQQVMAEAFEAWLKRHENDA